MHETIFSWIGAEKKRKVAFKKGRLESAELNKIQVSDPMILGNMLKRRN